MSRGGNLAQTVKQLLITELRYYFQVVSQFGFPNNPIKMPIIREAYGLVLRQYPMIIVKILHEEKKNLGIGRDFAEDVWSDDQEIGQQVLPGTENFLHPRPYQRRVIAERYGYMSDITFNIQVWGDTTPVRNKVTDELFDALDIYQRENLLNHGVQIMRVSMGEETDYPLNTTEKVYVANINLVLNAEAYFDQRVASITNVNAYGFRRDNTHPHTPPYILQRNEDTQAPDLPPTLPLDD